MDFLKLDGLDDNAGYDDDGTGVDKGSVDLSSFLQPNGTDELKEEQDSWDLAGSLPAPRGDEFQAQVPTQLSSSYSYANSTPDSIRASLSRALQPGDDSGSGSNNTEVKNVPLRHLSVTSNSASLSGINSSSNGVAGQPVDRKRRDNINEKIQDLLVLIPPEFFTDGKDKSSGTKDGKPNKGQILSKSVDYITWLQQKIDENNRREVELSIKLRNLELAKKVPVAERINLLHTSAEIGLAQIGVGPLAEEKKE